MRDDIYGDSYLHEVFDVDSPALLVEAGCRETMGKDDIAAADHFFVSALKIAGKFYSKFFLAELTPSSPPSAEALAPKRASSIWPGTYEIILPSISRMTSSMI